MWQALGTEPRPQALPGVPNMRGDKKASTKQLSRPEGLLPALPGTLAVRMHLQGVFILVVLLLVFAFVVTWGVRTIGDAATGPDGAIVATALDPAAREAAAPLEGGEVAALQSALVFAGYDPGPVDGILGSMTRAAIDLFKRDLGLTESTDRELMIYLVELMERETS